MPDRKPNTRRLIDETAPEMPRDGFDIVQIIGHVTVSTPGAKSPTEAAFSIIGQHVHQAGVGAEGTFSFPAEWNGTLHVTVETGPS